MSIKKQLLINLKKNKTAWVSGELLSSRLGVSRAAVWKQIRNLKEDGYEISSAPKKGYLLTKTPDLLLPEEICEDLNTRVFGRDNIVYFKELKSTNSEAKELASHGAPEGTVVIAEKQTGGRGRKGRNWFSPSNNNIYISLVLRPDMSPVEAPRMTLIAAVAAAEALIALTHVEVRIKWPNDILLGGKKIAGILTEISAESDAVDYIIVGLGLNVNTASDEFPPDIRNIATSILAATGKRFSRIKLVREYLILYEKYYTAFKKYGFKPVIRRWKELADMIGRRVQVDLKGKKYFGSVVDIDDNGVLILKDDHGLLHRIFSGDVSLI